MSQDRRFPRVVVSGLVFDAEDHVLLLKSDDWGGKYIIPGGKIRYGETIAGALRREISEETGLQISDPEFLFVAEGIEPAEAPGKGHSIWLVHRCRRAGGEVVLNHEAQGAIWAALDDALALPLSSPSRSTIEKLLMERQRQ